MERKIYDKKSSLCNCLNIRRASHAMTEIYDEFIAPSGVKLGQFSLLKHINELEPVNVSELASFIRLDRTTLVRNLKPLEEMGLVEDISPEGTRNRQLKLTDKGLKTYEAANKLWEKAQSFFKEYLGNESLENFTKVLSKIESLVQ